MAVTHAKNLQLYKRAPSTLQVWTLKVATFASSGPNQEFDEVLTGQFWHRQNDYPGKMSQNESRGLSKSCHFDLALTSP